MIDESFGKLDTVIATLSNVKLAHRAGLITNREADALSRTLRTAFRLDAGLKEFPEDVTVMEAYEADPST